MTVSGAPGPSKISVVIADDQRMVRAGLRMVIETESDMQVVGEAGDGVDAVTLTRRLRPDVVLMDIAMPRQDGLTATRALLAAPGAPRVIVLTTFDTDDNLYEALRAGASGFLLKVSSPSTSSPRSAWSPPARPCSTRRSRRGSSPPTPAPPARNRPRNSPTSPHARPTSCA